MRTISVSLNMDDILRERIEDIIYYEMEIPNEERIREYLRAEAENRPPKLDEKERAGVERYFQVEGMRAAVEERGWLLTMVKDRRIWDLDDQMERDPEFADRVKRILDNPEEFERFFGRLPRHPSPVSAPQKSPETVRAEFIEVEKRGFLRNLSDRETGNLTDDELFALFLRIEGVIAIEMVEKLRGMTSKVYAFRTSLANEKPSEGILGRLDEAFQCYLYGLNQACVTLCRSVLEMSLKEQLCNHADSRVVSIHDDHYLSNLIREAKDLRILSPGLARSAHAIRERGNKAVHAYSDAAAQDLSLDTITKLRHVLARLCR